MTVRIAQISDAHLSMAKPFFADNFACVAQAVRAARPDFVLATGDLSLAGADDDSEMTHAYQAHAAIGPEVLCVPGNHDVGNEPVSRRNPATTERVERWTRVAGPSAWARDLPGWRLIGLDNQSLSLGPAQWDVVGQAIRGAGSRRIALVQHKPLCIEALDETDRSYWALLPETRRQLLALFDGARPALVVSGHIHQARIRTADGIAQVWAPSTAFVLGDAYQPVYGDKRVGWVEHAFHADGTHEARICSVDGMRRDDIGEMPQVYRRMPTLDEQPDLWRIAP